MLTFEKVKIICKDQYILSGHFYPAKIAKTSQYPVLIAPATGIVKYFYHAFAEWLSAEGYDVLSFDFRGIGESLDGSLKHSKASIVAWGQLDLPASLDFLLEKSKADRAYIIGHSAGGQLLGIMPNHQRVAKMIAVSGSTGYVKGLSGRTKLLAPLMFKGIFPIARYTLGYAPTQCIGMGENLPKDVAQQWAIFCSRPGYIVNALGKFISENENLHHDVNTSITVLYATDDEIATEANVKDLIRLYPHASTKMIALHPSSYRYKKIGHMLMFKKSHQKLWPVIKAQLI